VAKIAARDVASSKDAKEAGQKIWTIWTAMDTSQFIYPAALFCGIVSYAEEGRYLLVICSEGGLFR
jgi:hypothetical protein